ncbi:MAG: hypothetical protein ACOC23_01870 [Thermodesulfobacteriota bacterium]
MDFKFHLERAWTMTLKYLGPLILITLATGVVGFISIGILAPVVLAGYMQSILLMIRSGREPKIQDIFSEMRLFLPLLGFGLAAAILIVIGFSLFFLPGIVVVFGISYACLYMIPLMTDRNFGLTDAIKESLEMVKGADAMDHVITAILFVSISAIGSSVFVGWLFTQPIATIFLLSVYEEKIQHRSATPPAYDTPPRSPTEEPGGSDELKQK